MSLGKCPGWLPKSRPRFASVPPQLGRDYFVMLSHTHLEKAATCRRHPISASTLVESASETIGAATDAAARLWCSAACISHTPVAIVDDSWVVVWATCGSLAPCDLRRGG